MGLTEWLPSALRPAAIEVGDAPLKQENSHSDSLSTTGTSAVLDSTPLVVGRENSSSSEIVALSPSTAFPETSSKEAEGMNLAPGADRTWPAVSNADLPPKRSHSIWFAEPSGSLFVDTGRGAQTLRSRTFTQGMDNRWPTISQFSPHYTGHEFAGFSGISAAGLRAFSPNSARASVSIATPSDADTKHSIAQPFNSPAEPRRVLRLINPDGSPIDEPKVVGLNSTLDPVPKIPQIQYWAATGPVSPEEFHEYKEAIEGYLRDASIQVAETQRQIQELGRAHENEKIEMQGQIDNLTTTNQQLIQVLVARDKAQESAFRNHTTAAEHSFEPCKDQELPRSLADQILELSIQVVLSRGEASMMVDDWAAMESHAEYAAQMASELIEPKAMIAHCHYHRGIALYNQGKFMLASEAFEASRDCEGFWKSASEINDWIRRVAQKTEDTAGFSAVPGFGGTPAMSGVFGKFGWETLGGLSSLPSAVSRASPSPSAISGLFGRFGWESLGGLSGLGTPKTPFSGTGASTWGQGCSRQTSILLPSSRLRHSASYEGQSAGSEASSSPSGSTVFASQASQGQSEDLLSRNKSLASLERSYDQGLDSPGSSVNQNSSRGQHLRNTSDFSITSEVDSDLASTSHQGSRTSRSPSLVRPPSPLRIQRPENRFLGPEEASPETISSGQPIAPLSYQKTPRRTVSPPPTPFAIPPRAGKNAKTSMRPLGHLDDALRNLRPLAIPPSSSSSSLVTSNSDYSVKASSPDQILRPKVAAARMTISPEPLEPLRIINRGSRQAPETSSVSAATSPSGGLKSASSTLAHGGLRSAVESTASGSDGEGLGITSFGRLESARAEGNRKAGNRPM